MGNLGNLPTLLGITGFWANMLMASFPDHKASKVLRKLNPIPLAVCILIFVIVCRRFRVVLFAKDAE